MIEWLDEFYGSTQTRAALMTSFAPLFHEYANGVWAAEGGKGEPPEPFVEGLIDGYVSHHIESSRAQLQEVVAGDKSFAELATRLDEWAEKRPGKVADNETVRTSNAIALEAMRSMGAKEKVWVVSGTCDFCQEMAGKRAALNEPFLSAGDEVNPEGKEPMRVRSNVGHPPLHQGCQCSIEPDGFVDSSAEDRELADSISSRADGFGEQGGDLELNVAEARRDAVRVSVDEMLALLPKNTFDPGFTFTKTAMFQDVAHVAAADGGVAGAIGMHVSELGFLHIEYLGSTGIAQGTGSALVRQAILDAAASGQGLSLNPTSSALPFWKKMGMVENPWGITGEDAEDLWGMTAATVRALAEAMT